MFCGILIRNQCRYMNHAHRFGANVFSLHPDISQFHLPYSPKANGSNYSMGCVAVKYYQPSGCSKCIFRFKNATTLKTKAAGSSETWIPKYQTTRCQIAYDSSHRRDSLSPPYPLVSDRPLGPPILQYNTSPRIKRSVRDADHSAQSNAKVKNVWSHT